MQQRIAQFTIVVREYDEAIEFYTRVLGFRLVEDTRMTDEKRWVVVAPQGSTECAVLLARAASEQQRAAIGSQTGGRVAFFLYTDDFERDYQSYKDKGVTFVREPSNEPYGRVAVFADLYGNLWDLIQPA